MTAPCWTRLLGQAVEGETRGDLLILLQGLQTMVGCREVEKALNRMVERKMVRSANTFVQRLSVGSITRLMSTARQRLLVLSLHKYATQ